MGQHNELWTSWRNFELYLWHTSIGPAYLYECVRWGVRAEARGIWGHAAPGNFFWIWCCEIASEAILGPKTSQLIIAFAQVWYQDSDSLQVCTHGDKWPSAVSSPLRTTWRSNSHKPVRILLSILSYRNPSENVWPLRSKSARSHVSPALCYVPTVTFVWAWICTDNTQTSRLKAKGRRCYLSQNIGPAVAGSARLAPPPLPKHFTFFSSQIL